MKDSALTLVILGVYTAIYLYTFFIQRKQIESIKAANEANKSVVDSMQTLVSIMNVDHFKKYSDMRIETAKMELKETLTNDSKLQEMITESSKLTLDKVKIEYEKIMDKRVNELFAYTMFTLRNIPKKDRKELVELNFPENADFILKAFVSYDANNDNNTP